MGKAIFILSCFLLISLSLAGNFTHMSLHVDSCTGCSDCCFRADTSLSFTRDNISYITFRGNLTGSCSGVIKVNETCSVEQSTSSNSKYYMTCEDLGQHGQYNLALLKNNGTDKYYFSWSQGSNQCEVVLTVWSEILGVKLFVVVIALWGILF